MASFYTAPPTVVTYEGDGETKDFSFPFQYIKEQYIEVLVDETDLDQGDGWDLAPGQTQVVRFDTAPDNGAEIMIRRRTRNEDMLVDFQDASVLREKDLDRGFRQLLHLYQEAFTESGNALELTQEIADTLGASVDASFQWANRAEDDSFDFEGNSGYSAFHWSEKASQSATEAETAETEAKTARDAAQLAQTEAESAQGDAENAAEDAFEWANADEDISLDLGGNTGYSAFHWSQKSEASASSAEASANQAELHKDAAASSESTAAQEASDAISAADAASASASEAGGYASDAESARDAASQAKDAAEQAQTGAETAETNAGQSATDASASAGAADTAKDDAEAARDAAQAAEANAEDAQTGAETAMATAEDYRDQALTFQNQAEQYRDQAETAESEAKTARDAAQLAESNAEDAQTGAETARDESQGYRDQSRTARDEARAAEDDAKGYRDQSRTARNESRDARDDSETYRDHAYDWANADEDTPISHGGQSGYSAYHWSEKAKENAGGGDADSLGGYPAADYPRRDEDEELSGKWTFGDTLAVEQSFYATMRVSTTEDSTYPKRWDFVAGYVNDGELKLRTNGDGSSQSYISPDPMKFDVEDKTLEVWGDRVMTRTPLAIGRFTQQGASEGDTTLTGNGEIGITMIFSVNNPGNEFFRQHPSSTHGGIADLQVQKDGLYRLNLLLTPVDLHNLNWSSGYIQILSNETSRLELVPMHNTNDRTKVAISNVRHLQAGEYMWLKNNATGQFRFGNAAFTSALEIEYLGPATDD